MAGQDFERMLPLVPLLEELVVRDHRALHRNVLRERWSRPRAYHWMRYEDPDPIARLIDATRRLDAEWSGRSQARPRDDLARALDRARRLGYPGASVGPGCLTPP